MHPHHPRLAQAVTGVLCLEEIARPQPVVRVDLSRNPAAATLPVRSVPAVISVGRRAKLPQCTRLA